MKLFGDKSKEIKELQPEGKTEDEKKYAPPEKLPKIKKPLPPPPQPHRQLRPPGSPGSPPLFIKVNKYRDIVKNIRDLKSHILNLRDALDVLSDMQKEVANGIEIAHKNIDELNAVIANLDTYIMKPQGLDHHMDEERLGPTGGPGEVEGQMKDVYGQVEKLRAQLRAIR